MPKNVTASVRFAMYLRCSSDDQRHGDFTTIDAQRQINLRYIAEQGGVLIGEYNDEGRTGTNLKRSDWKRLKRDAEARLFDKVVVTYMSRLGRGKTFYIAEYLLEEAGVEVALVKEEFTPDLAGYANQSVKVFLDGMYPIQVAEWTRAKMKEMIENGYWCGGTLPLGYMKVEVANPKIARHPDKPPPKRLVPNPDEVPFVIAAGELYVDTGSYARVQSYLEAVTGHAWRLDQVKYLLTNEVYRGVLRHGDWRKDNAHEPIMPDEVWEKIQTRERERIREPKSDPKDQNPYYLRGLVYCGFCGHRMTPASHHGRAARVSYYECVGSTRKKACPVKRINAYSLHKAVLEHIERGATHPTRMAEIIREAVKAVPPPERSSSELEALKRRLRECERKIKHCLNAVETGGATVRPLIKRLEELEAERLHLEQAKLTVEKQIAESKIARPEAVYVQSLWSRFMELWEEATDAERAELLPLLVERVEMQEKERGYCRLLFAAHHPRLLPASTSRNVEINYDLGAGVGLEPTTFGL